MWLSAALILALDSYAQLACRGLADATGLARNVARPRSRRTTRPKLAVTAPSMPN